MTPITGTRARTIAAQSHNDDDIRCCLCRRLHRPEPADSELECRVDYCWVTETRVDSIDDEAKVINLGSQVTPAVVCQDCRTDPGAWPQHITKIEPMSPVDQLQHIDAEFGQEMDDSLEQGVPEDERRRGQHYAVADRILYRLAQDEAERAALEEARTTELALVTRRYQALIETTKRASWWKRNALDAITQTLFPSPDLKKKSIALTYGTIGRKDYKPAPELLDEQAALAACRASGNLKFTQYTLKFTGEDLALFVHDIIQLHGLTGGGEPFSVELAAKMIDMEENGDAKVGLTWSALKKHIAATGESIDGTRFSEGKTEYVAEVTRG